jgi:lipoate-protein ligase A
MQKLFSHLEVWEDAGTRGPAAQMACDEALLDACERPVLRAYRWHRPAVTFGYAQKFGVAERLAGGLPLMRRWSGGGMVFHGRDLTLALAIPASGPLAAGTSSDIYRTIHEGLLAAIQTKLPGARLVSPEECRCGPVCFESPVAFDIISGNSKICGGALRRSKGRVLYQGSLHLEEADLSEIARSLALEVSHFQKSSTLEPAVDRLVSSKYAAPEWLAMR